jgi:hypothetical protein
MSTQYLGKKEVKSHFSGSDTAKRRAKLNLGRALLCMSDKLSSLDNENEDEIERLVCK